MGPDFAFVTRVGLSGESLVVIGSGDPLLGDKETDARNGHRRPPVLRDIIDRFKESGVVSLSDIILDGSVFDEQRVHPGWPANQLNQKYACEVSGLNYRGKCADVAVLNQGGRIVISLEPPTEYVNLINAVRPRSYGRSRISLDRTEVPGELIVSGTCRDRAGPYSFAVENPALFFSHLLRDGLVKAGIRVTGQILERPMPDDADYRPLAEYRTLLGDCLMMANKESLGLAAEALFKRLGAQANPDGRGGSWESGRRVLGRVRAKSGYLKAVRALSGVVRTDGGDYFFSFLANRGGNGTRLAIDAAVKAIVDWGAAPANPSVMKTPPGRRGHAAAIS
ncbi:MAG: D-alanyl-D-alanine carboxypeptidase [Candidatus Aminicenantes bacterium]|nr:D-alanyl-D-alanine carboxypeptidase [Candidatus Aminicenantes bacterium]